MSSTLHTQSRPDVVDELLQYHALIAGDIFQVDVRTWAIHGSVPVDGEVILAEFDRPETARSVLARLALVEAGAAPGIESRSRLR